MEKKNKTKKEKLSWNIKGLLVTAPISIVNTLVFPITFFAPIVPFVNVLCFLIIGICGLGICSRAEKQARTRKMSIQIYSASGVPIYSCSGKIEILDDDSESLKFIWNGKKYEYKNCITEIVEEKSGISSY